jgi:hypothetical protein
LHALAPDPYFARAIAVMSATIPAHLGLRYGAFFNFGDGVRGALMMHVTMSRHSSFLGCCRSPIVFIAARYVSGRWCASVLMSDLFLAVGAYGTEHQRLLRQERRSLRLPPIVVAIRLPV